MFSSSAKQLDLSTLESYSPKWSHDLRLATCIATKYAVHRYIDRSSSLGTELAQDWTEYGQKFLTATCQHLGVPEESLPPSPISLEGVLTAAQGRTEEDDPELQSRYEPHFESGSDHVRRFPKLALPIEGVDDASKASVSDVPPVTEADARKREIERAFADLDLDDAKSIKTSSEDSDHQFNYDDDAKELPEHLLSGSNVDVSEKQPRQDSQSNPDAAIAAPRRVQGVIDSSGGQDIEIAHELLLVALGLGQFRAQDGSTTLFEQDMLFGDTELEPHAARPDNLQSDSAASLEAETKADPPPFQNETLNAVAGAGKLFAGASKTAFTSLKSNTVTGWSKVSSASKDLVTPAAATKQANRPVKPNELCHYDARARAIIFVALNAMGVAGRQVWLAEKVMGQTIYFIMAEGNRAAASRDGRDLIQSLPPGAALDPKTGEVTEGSERSAWMNEHSGSVVQREKGKAGWGKWAAMGGGFIAGGLVIGLTGGLAAPLIAPALVGLTGASFLATSGGIVMLGTLFGLGGGGLAGYKVERRLRGVESFAFTQLQTEAHKAGVAIPSLHATICCSGLLLDQAEQVDPWASLFADATDGRDAFAISYETEMMKEAGVGLRSYMLDQLVRSGGTKAAEEIIKRTALAGIAAITLPLTVFNAASATLDGVFVRAKTKSHKAGVILAETLKNEVQGHRPVVLIGTSLGAATILSALIELAKEPERNAHLVDSVYLISAPITPSPGTMKKVRSVVQRRFVNVFSSNDMVCGIAAWLGSGISVEELRSGKLPRVAGSRPILDCPGLENINASDLITSHFEVNDAAKLHKVLSRCGVMED